MSTSISYTGLVLALSALVVPLSAAATACPQHFVNGQPPAIVQAKLKVRTQELCFISYAVLHSGVSRTPLYTAEHLQRENLLLAKKLSRKDSFHAESALPPSDRAELSDYQRSGYDRGHMAPNADMPTREAQYESFSLANMVPQVHANNAGVWAGIESAARNLAMQEGEVYVVSGPAFVGSNVNKIGNVLVPTHLWKAIYSPKQQRAGAYLITNDESKDYSAMSITDLEKMVGLNVWPSLPVRVREAGMDLPKPESQRGGDKNRSKNQPPEDEFQLKDFARGVIDLIQRAMQK